MEVLLLSLTCLSKIKNRIRQKNRKTTIRQNSTHRSSGASSSSLSLSLSPCSLTNQLIIFIFANKQTDHRLTNMLYSNKILICFFFVSALLVANQIQVIRAKVDVSFLSLIRNLPFSSCVVFVDDSCPLMLHTLAHLIDCLIMSEFFIFHFRKRMLSDLPETVSSPESSKAKVIRRKKVKESRRTENSKAIRRKRRERD